MVQIGTNLATGLGIHAFIQKPTEAPFIPAALWKAAGGWRRPVHGQAHTAHIRYEDTEAEPASAFEVRP